MTAIRSAAVWLAEFVALAFMWMSVTGLAVFAGAITGAIR